MADTHLGLIAILFPKARVIHTRRDPLDTCLSCFTQLFPRGAHLYSCDLTFLGRAYRRYERVMAHWAETLDHPLIEVRYESLVADPDAGIRTLIERLGLPWDERCLRFHESTRPVRTSTDQVVQPIYDRSVGRAARFGSHLDPLRAALENG